MAEFLRLPRMSDTMEEGVIASIAIKVGDTLNPGDLIGEVETDKAAMDWESDQEGVVLHILAGEGDAIPVNGRVAILGEEGESFEELLNSAEEEAPAAPAEEPAAPKADKPSTEVSAPAPSVKEVSQAPQSQPTSSNEDSRVKASPLARKMAEDFKVNLSNVQGSGEDGRIVKRDVEAYAENPIPSVNKVFTATLEARDERVSMMRKTIAKRLSESKFTAPHFYLKVSVDMRNAMKARKDIKAAFDMKFSFNDLVIKACAMALRKHPNINASWLGDIIRYHADINIGMAVAVDEGLVVPVIKHADQLGLSEISAAARGFVEKARQRQLASEEMQGNTFSISNLGMMGIDEFTAIVNPPDACILAVGAIRPELALEDGELVEKQMMKLTLSCDHRVVDGAVGAAFLATLKGHLENPVSMLL
ncbi:MAG: dihydrolipoamide acetyltransferase family protein [Bacteroidota bacterium]|nr:dihydrolipoamide acetyltransferase family protein [Bacteroidota bacterium]MEC8835247.1 dihydrolipoamide acetyltransferase family protein [Bacteroidota bacterium]